MRPVHVVTLALALALSASSTALSQPAVAPGPDGDAILKKVEDTMNAPKDRSLVVEMAVVDKGGDRKTRVMKLRQLRAEPDDARIIRFDAPAKIAGTAFLSKSDDEMYMYLPAFKKVRRIASSARGQAFVGTAFSYADIGNTRYTDDYHATVTARGDGTVTLECLPTDAADADYAKLVMVVDTATWMYRKVELYETPDKLAKVMTQDRIEQVGGYQVGKHVVMEDVRSQQRTELELKSVEFDTGLGDDAFTKRQLERAW